MRDMLDNNLPQIVAALGAFMLIGIGRSPLLPKARSKKWLMWVAFAVSAVAGLMLGYALVGVMGWLTGLTGAGAVAGSAGSIIAVFLGWWAIKKLVALVRDLADHTPDEAARSAALWVPTLAPAGWSAAWGIVQNPDGLGTGPVAATLAAITIVSARSIVGDALASRNHQVPWKWFAAAVSLLAGLVMLPLVLFVDGWAANGFPDYILWIRVVAGLLGVCLAVAALVDIADRVPDGYARAFLQMGLPLLLLFGALGWATVTGSAANGVEVLQGTFR